jgi:hypothetical protein
LSPYKSLAWGKKWREGKVIARRRQGKRREGKRDGEMVDGEVEETVERGKGKERGKERRAVCRHPGSSAY